MNVTKVFNAKTFSSTNYNDDHIMLTWFIAPTRKFTTGQNVLDYKKKLNDANGTEVDAANYFKGKKVQSVNISLEFSCANPLETYWKLTPSRST
jgi:hypothetical protein